MLRISEPEVSESVVTLRLEGQIIGAWVDELRRSTEQFQGNSHRLMLDLTDVTFADQAGVALLASFHTKTVGLTGCSRFLEEQLKRAN